MKPQSTLKLNGSLDLYRESINQQKPNLSGKILKPIRKPDTLGPFGELDLSRPERWISDRNRFPNMLALNIRVIQFKYEKLKFHHLFNRSMKKVFQNVQKWDI